MTIVTRAFVGQGQWLRLPYPSYILYQTLAQLQGAHGEEIHFRADWTLDDSFAAPRSDLRLAFLPNPNSPSGTVLSPERVLELADRLPCPLLVDEAYVDFANDHCLRLVAQNEKILVSRSLSKSYALAGLRFGFLVAQPHIIQQLVKVKDSYNCDALSIAGATAAIDDQAWLAETRARIIATRGRLAAGMRPSRVFHGRVAGEFCLEPAPPRAGATALRTAETRGSAGALYGLCGLGGRPADFRRQRRPNRRLSGPVAIDDLNE